MTDWRPTTRARRTTKHWRRLPQRRHDAAGAFQLVLVVVRARVRVRVQVLPWRLRLLLKR